MDTEGHRLGGMAPPDSSSDPIAGVCAGSIINLQDLVIEDLQRLDVFTQSQERLLTGPLYSCWHERGGHRTFQVCANVGLFSPHSKVALRPDIMLAVNIPVGRDPNRLENQAYFTWIKGK